MDIIIQSLGFKASEHLETYLQDKLEKLEPLHHNILRANVTLFQAPDSNLSNSYCEIRLEVPGNDPFVKKHAESFEQSISEAADALHSILRKNKEKEMDRQHAH